MMRGLFVFVAACGASTGSPATPASSGPVKAPACIVDKPWAENNPSRDVHRLLPVGGSPAYLQPDEPDRKRIFISDLDTGKVLTTLPIPESSMNVWPLEAIPTARGATLFVGGSTQVPEGDLSVTSAYWMLEVDLVGRVGKPTPLTLPAAYSWETHFAIVGEHVIALLVVPDDPDPDAPLKPDDNNLVILDKAGNVVRSLRDKGLFNVFAIGDSAFGVFQNLGSKHDVIRVFDLVRRDWIGPAFDVEYRVAGAIGVGDRAVLVGHPPDPLLEASGNTMTTDRPAFAAWLDTTGKLSPWKSLDVKVHAARLVLDYDRRQALLLAAAGATRDKSGELRVTAIAPDLSFAHSKSSGEVYGLGYVSLVLRDAIYVVPISSPERFACSR